MRPINDFLAFANDAKIKRSFSFDHLLRLSKVLCTLLRLYKKYGPIPASFSFIFVFSHYNINHNFNNANWKNIDDVLGIRTLGRRMLGADDTTELSRLFCLLASIPTYQRTNFISLVVRKLMTKSTRLNRKQQNSRMVQTLWLKNWQHWLLRSAFLQQLISDDNIFQI